MAAHERDDAVRVLAAYLERLVDSVREQFRIAVPQRKRTANHMLLDATVAPTGRQLADGPALQADSTRGKINGPPVIRIDQAKIPELGALIDVGDTGRGELEQGLCEAVHRTGRTDSLGERNDVN